ncbi:MAG: photosynthetic complex putative assembly protein PuhB [Alphaproteobacteria bacterium]|nr:photosynthetic complex putative assembly protein PuhB [Alphaproteobacteria bacterium]
MSQEPRHHHLSPDIPEHDYEAVPGLPERLPEGETLLWQGRPEWRGFASRAMGLKGFAAYFLGLLAVQLAWGIAAGHPLSGIVFGMSVLFVMGAVVIGLLALVGWLSARSALYTVTSKRVVLRVGIALPMTINIPFAVVDSLARREHADGTEDLVLKIMRPHRLSWVALWPHCRVPKLFSPEPMLRAIPVQASAAQVLARALAAHAGAAVQPIANNAGTTASHGAAVAA